MECLCLMNSSQSMYDKDLTIWVCPECDFHIRSVGDHE